MFKKLLGAIARSRPNGTDLCTAKGAEIGSEKRRLESILRNAGVSRTVAKRIVSEYFCKPLRGIA